MFIIFYKIMFYLRMAIMYIWLPDHSVTSPQVSKWTEKRKMGDWIMSYLPVFCQL
jgi:hypothetical protein